MFMRSIFEEIYWIEIKCGRVPHWDVWNFGMFFRERAKRVLECRIPYIPFI